MEYIWTQLDQCSYNLKIREKWADCIVLPSQKSSVEVTESRLCWSLLSESLRRGRGPAHAPPGCSVIHDDEEEEEGAWWTNTVSAWRREEKDEEEVDGRQKSKSLWWRVLLELWPPVAPWGSPSESTIGTLDSGGTGGGGEEGGGREPEGPHGPLLPYTASS